MMRTKSIVRGLTSHILMVRPANFGFNKETAQNNTFQRFDKRLGQEEIKEKAKAEFDEFVKKLRSAGVEVMVVEDTAIPLKTDSVFPNNWISFHENGWVVTYPMFSTVRRLERRKDIIEKLGRNFEINRHLDLSEAELDGRFLEGTGSMVLDRKHKLAYACLAERTDEGLIDEFCQELGYYKVIFNATDSEGIPIYHTNVMMAMGEDFVVICMDSIRDEGEKEMLLKSFAETAKEVVNISVKQMESFAGNMLQVKNDKEESFLVMSSSAFHSLSASQIQQLEQYTHLLHSDLHIIETYSGGSARCMMAEIFLPAK